MKEWINGETNSDWPINKTSQKVFNNIEIMNETLNKRWPINAEWRGSGTATTLAFPLPRLPASWARKTGLLQDFLNFLDFLDFYDFLDFLDFPGRLVCCQMWNKHVLRRGFRMIWIKLLLDFDLYWILTDIGFWSILDFNW